MSDDYNTKIRERLYSKSVEVDGCLEFTGARSSGGYGNIRYRGKPTGAHRVSWIVHFGEIPDGMQIMHICDNPVCIQPFHFRLGTNQENMDDKMQKGRFKARNTAKKYCDCCGKEYPITIKNGRTIIQCLDCKREKDAIRAIKYREENPDYKPNYDKEYRAKNIERIREYDRIRGRAKRAKKKLEAQNAN